MAIIKKICLFIFIFLLSLFTCVQAEDCVSNANDTTEMYQYIANNIDCESYIAHAPKSFDEILDTDFKACCATIYEQNFCFSETKHVNHNITLIAFLFKTEIFPNAP